MADVSSILMFVQHSYLLAGFPEEYMLLPAEVLPELHHSPALSGQPEAQRGLWILHKGTGGTSLKAPKWCACVWVSQNGGKDAIYLDNAAGSSVPSVRGDTQHCCPNSKQAAQCHQGLPKRGMWPFVPCVTFPVIMLMYLLGLLLCFGLRSHLSSHAFHRPSPPSPLHSDKHRDKLFHLLTSPLFFPPSHAVLSFSVVWEERTVPEAASARPAGGAVAEANSIPAVVAEYCEEVPDRGRDQRPAGYSGTSGHIYMWATCTTLSTSFSIEKCDVLYHLNISTLPYQQTE